DENKIDIAINKLIKDTGIPPIYEESSHNCIEWSNGYISIQEEFSDYDDNDNLSEYGIYFDCHVHNPFESYIGVDGYSFQDIYSNSKGDSKNIRTVPLPAAIGFHYSKDNCTVDFDYYASNANYFSKKIEYQYNFDTKEFELQYDLSSNFEDRVNLNEQQIKQLRNAICDFFYENLELSTEATEFGARGKYFWLENYGAYQSETTNNLYKIDMSFTPYDIMITSGVYDYISFNNGEPVLGATFFVEFKDNKAELIDWYYPEGFEYSSTDELAEIAKGYYNKSSLEKLIKSDPAKLADNPYNESKDKELVNLQNIIRDNYYNRYQK
ncbi:MAG: hypothetical protein IJ927_02510, partial [Eubacterium sp.]|nr:hypothetical protein [Eubacterium sp.]